MLQRSVGMSICMRNRDEIESRFKNSNKKTDEKWQKDSNKMNEMHSRYLSRVLGEHCRAWEDEGKVWHGEVMVNKNKLQWTKRCINESERKKSFSVFFALCFFLCFEPQMDFRWLSRHVTVTKSFKAKRKVSERFCCSLGQIKCGEGRPYKTFRQRFNHPTWWLVAVCYHVLPCVANMWDSETILRNSQDIFA